MWKPTVVTNFSVQCLFSTKAVNPQFLFWNLVLPSPSDSSSTNWRSDSGHEAANQISKDQIKPQSVWTYCSTYYRCSRDISSTAWTQTWTQLMFNDLVSVRSEQTLLLCVCYRDTLSFYHVKQKQLITGLKHQTPNPRAAVLTCGGSVVTMQWFKENMEGEGNHLTLSEILQGTQTPCGRAEFSTKNTCNHMTCTTETRPQHRKNKNTLKCRNLPKRAGCFTPGRLTWIFPPVKKDVRHLCDICDESFLWCGCSSVSADKNWFIYRKCCGAVSVCRLHPADTHRKTECVCVSEDWKNSFLQRAV